MQHHVSHLEGAIDGTRLPPDVQHGTHAGRPITVHYHLERIRAEVDRDALTVRTASLWRYDDLLPIAADQAVTLGEGMTPLLDTPRLGAALGLDRLAVKDDSQMPTGSFKDRGQSLAISMARHFGTTRVAIPTAGNAGGSMAHYAARAGMQAFVFMPRDTPAINRYETALAGAHAYLVDGLINDCGAIVREGAERFGWFDLSTLKEPYRLEGKKTMGLELAEQRGWTLPDVILYPTGGGTGLIGMWKAFQELTELGWLEQADLPRMVAVQSEGCCPIVRAFEAGERFAEPFADAATMASGLRVPVAVGDFMILDAIRDSDGTAVAVAEERIKGWMDLATRSEGIAVCPETACCVGAAEQLRASGWLAADAEVVIFNCGTARKYPDVIARDLPQFTTLDQLDRGTAPAA